MEYSTLRRRARENLRGNWGVSVGAAFVALLFGALLTSGGVTNVNLDEELLYELPDVILQILSLWLSVSGVLGFASFIIGGTIQLGYCRFLLNQHDGQPHSLSDLFSQFDRFGTGFAQAFLRGLYVFLWSLLLVIPGIVKSFSYAMTPFLLAEYPELTVSQAITLSRKIMDGHKADLFFLGLSFIGWALLSILTCGIGSLWLNPYVNATWAAFYRQLQAETRYTSVEG